MLNSSTSNVFDGVFPQSWSNRLFLRARLICGTLANMSNKAASKDVQIPTGYEGFIRASIPLDQKRKRILILGTDIRSWLDGIISSLQERQVAARDLDYLDDELRLVEKKLEMVTSIAILDR